MIPKTCTSYPNRYFISNLKSTSITTAGKSQKTTLIQTTLIQTTLIQSTNNQHHTAHHATHHTTHHN